MAQFLNTPWISTPVPGAYVNTTVISGSSGLASSGVVLIMGEADGGPDYTEVTLANNFYGPTALNQVRALYVGGPIVDAFAALSAPSNDPDIVGTASSIYIIKTNKGTQATASVPGYGTFTALNYGTAGNLFNYTVTSTNTEVPPQVTGTTVPAFGAPLNGDTFTIRLNGGVADVITLSSNSGGASPSAAQTAASAAYTSLAGHGGYVIIPSALDGQTLTAGYYNFTSGAATLAASGPGTLTLSGSPTDVFVIKTASTLTTGAGGTPTITLAGGALAENVYWIVGSSATINSGFTGTFQGNIIAQASVTNTLGGTVNGSLIALTGAVTLSAATNVNAQSAPLLGVAGAFGLLGASGVTNTGATVVNGDVGSSPTNSVVGFPPGVVNTPAHDNIAELIIELNSLLPAGITASEGAAPNTVELTMAGSAFPYASGSGESFELIDSTPGDLAALGLTAGLYTSSEEPAVEVQIINATAGVNETFTIAPNIAMTVGYNGTTATLTSNGTTLTTTVTGGTGANLSITLAQYTTISQLAAFINAQTGYSATAGAAATSLPTSALDHVVAIGINSTTGAQPGRIKDSVYAFQQAMNTSTVLGFTATATSGLPVPGPLVYLAGGTLGPTLAIDIVNAIAQMAGINVNIIVPLFSQDATKDITAGNTDPASTYTIAAINELLKSHCIEYSTPTLKRNRMAILSYNDTYANCKAQAQSLASYRCSMTFQQVTQVNSAGVNQLFLPWYASCVAAGTQCGGFYKSICNHLANIVSFTNPVGYDSGDPADVADAIIAGMLSLTQNTSGILWTSDQSTYGLDSNFVYNSIQAVYLSDILALDLAQSFQTAIVGKSVADVSAASALSFLQQRFDFYKKLKMTTTSSDAPLGYKNASITISAPTMTVNVEAKLTTSIYFVAINLSLSAVQQSAS
jgi:hypothetical protein